MSARPSVPPLNAMANWRRAALQRYNSLRKIRATRHGRPLANPGAWAILIANAIEALGEFLDADSLVGAANRIGIALDPDAINVGLTFRLDRERGYGPGRRLVRADVAGHMLQLTAAERDAARVVDIDAHDETRADRKRRLDRQWRAARRGAAGLKPATPTTIIEHGMPWLAAGISRRTWYRNRAKERLGTEPVVRPSSERSSQELDLVDASACASKKTTPAVPNAVGNSVENPRNLRLVGDLDQPSSLSSLSTTEPGLPGGQCQGGPA